MVKGRAFLSVVAVLGALSGCADDPPLLSSIDAFCDGACTGVVRCSGGQWNVCYESCRTDPRNRGLASVRPEAAAVVDACLPELDCATLSDGPLTACWDRARQETAPSRTPARVLPRVFDGPVRVRLLAVGRGLRDALQHLDRRVPGPADDVHARSDVRGDGRLPRSAIREHLMALASARKAWLACAVVGVFGAIAGGCGDDPSVSPPPGGGKLHPVPGCEAIDPSPCDVFSTSCQTRLMELAACLRGSPPQALPPVSRMTEAEYAQHLTDLILAEDPPPNLNHYEAALVTLGLVVPGAFTPSSMAAERAAWVWGVYRHDTDDIVLIDRCPARRTTSRSEASLATPCSSGTSWRRRCRRNGSPPTSSATSRSGSSRRSRCFARWRAVSPAPTSRSRWPSPACCASTGTCASRATRRRTRRTSPASSAWRAAASPKRGMRRSICSWGSTANTPASAVISSMRRASRAGGGRSSARRARALLGIIARLRRKGYEAGGYEHYARVPKGFAPDHPRAELLKYKGLICEFPAIPAGLLHKPALARWLLAPRQGDRAAGALAAPQSRIG